MAECGGVMLILNLMMLIMMSATPVAGDCEKLGACSCQSEMGIIDLSPLASSSGPAFKDLTDKAGAWRYSWNPCTPFSEFQCSNVSACQVSMVGTESYEIGMQDTATFTPIPGSEDVLLTYTASSPQVSRTTLVTLKCDPTIESKLDVQGEQGYAMYIMTLTSKYCCPGVRNISTTNLSPGTIIIIVFGGLALVYLVAGVVVQKAVHKATGKEVIPNYLLWFSLPGLIKCFRLEVSSHYEGKELEFVLSVPRRDLNPKHFTADGFRFTTSCGKMSYEKV